MLNEVSPLDCHALLTFTLFAAVPSRASLGNELRAEQFCHADVKLVQFLMSVVLKSLSDVQPSHDRTTLEAKGSGVSKTISEVQVSHARNALPTKGSSELKLVRL